MKDVQAVIIYVGKAKDLKKRVSSYFQNKEQTLKTSVLTEHIADIDTIITSTEVEALLLENRLIKEHQPKFNVLLKDDKTYPYIKVTVSDPFPRVLKTRIRISDGSRYFGPYPSDGVLTYILSLIDKAFLARKCPDPMPRRLCLSYHLKQCVGPCELESAREQYPIIVEDIVQVLEGKNQPVIERITGQMRSLAEAHRYEEAALLRDQLKALQRLQEKQLIVQDDLVSRDVFALAQDGKKIYVILHQYRQGMLAAQQGYFVSSTDDLAQMLHQALIEHYIHASEIPREILCEIEPSQTELLTEWLRSRCDHAVDVQIPERGDKRQWVLLAKRNAMEKTKPGAAHPFKTVDHIQLLEQLQKDFALTQLPRHMECVDISNTGQRVITGATVAFYEGRPEKKYYRHYTVQSLVKQRLVKQQDDYQAMREVVERRIKQPDLPRPQLLLVDGGEGHVHVVRELLQELGVKDMDIRGLAKREEEIVFPDLKRRRKLDPHQAAHRIFLAMRDEAHRFSNRLRENQWQRRSLQSILSEIAGLGPKRQKLLLEHFGTVETVAKASLSQLKRVENMSDALAESIYKKFRPGRREAS